MDITFICGRDSHIIAEFGKRNARLNTNLHLFPELHAPLGGVAFPIHPFHHTAIIQKIVEKGDPAWVVTHSEHMILWVMREVAQGRLAAKDVSVIYLDASQFAHRLRVDQEGDFIDRWPEGFFEERMELLFS